MKVISKVFYSTLCILLVGCSSDNDQIIQSTEVDTKAVTYDYYVSVTGNDNSAGTSSAPFKTIQKALNMNRKVSSRANIIKVNDGTYYEAIIIQSGKGGDLHGNTANPGKVVINASGKNTSVMTVNYPVVLRGFTLTGGSVSGNAGGGIYMPSGSGADISHCIITGNSSGTSGAAAIYSSSANFDIFNSLIYKNTGTRIIDFPNYGSFSNCTIADNIGTYAITVRGEKLYFMYSILYNSQCNHELRAESVSGRTVEIGIQYCNIRDGLSTVSGNPYYLGTPTVQNANPLFTNSSQNDYTLASGSPCIDAGSPPAHYSPEMVPPGKGTTRPDMGAYGGPYNVNPRF